jgi:hypothetical protein
MTALATGWAAGFSRSRGRTSLPVALLTLAVGALALAAAYAGARGHLVVTAGVAAVPFLVGLLVVPTRSLPAIAILVLVLVPIGEAPSAAAEHLPLATIPLFVWMLRVRRRPIVVIAIPALALLVWVVLSFMFAPIATRAGLLWTIGFAVSPCLLCLTGARLEDQRPLALLVAVMSVLGVYAGIEAFVVHGNPLMDPLYRSATSPVRQVWGTYRATTILGHPLVNATFFAVAGVLAFDRYLAGQSRYAGLQTCLLVLGEVATKSRAAMVALAAGMLMLMVLRLVQGASRRRLAVAAAGLAVSLVVGAAVFIARNSTVEAQRSTNDRTAVVANAEQAIAGHVLLGVGPGESEAYRVAARLRGVASSANYLLDHPSQPPPDLEDAFAEMAVSIGVPGLALFVLLLLAAAGVAFTHPETQAVGLAIGVFAVCIAGYNALEGHQQLLVLLGLLLAAVATRARDSVRSGP